MQLFLMIYIVKNVGCTILVKNYVSSIVKKYLSMLNDHFTESIIFNEQIKLLSFYPLACKIYLEPRA